jgi:hypothetical protein
VAARQIRVRPAVLDHLTGTIGLPRGAVVCREGEFAGDVRAWGGKRSKRRSSSSCNRLLLAAVPRLR